MADPIDVGDFGKFSIAADASAPLLIVFGGIVVGGEISGVYMWHYMQPIQDRYHIFVAHDNTVNGTRSYDALMKLVDSKKLTPSTQILYLFSGGYRPGMDLLPGTGHQKFSAIYLVDIWMGIGKDKKSVVPNFYKKFVDANGSKTTYVYTEHGAVNDNARDYLANKVQSATLVAGNHMSTNITAIHRLP